MARRAVDQLWLDLAEPHFPGESIEELMKVRMWAANYWLWAEGMDKEDLAPLQKLYAELYDQYVMMKQLKGL